MRQGIARVGTVGTEEDGRKTDDGQNALGEEITKWRATESIAKEVRTKAGG